MGGSSTMCQFIGGGRATNCCWGVFISVFRTHFYHPLVFISCVSFRTIKKHTPSNTCRYLNLPVSSTGEATLPGLACTDEEKAASGWALSLLLFLLVFSPEDGIRSVLPWAWGSFSGIWVRPAARPLRPLEGLSLWLAGAGGSWRAKWSNYDGTARHEDRGRRQWIQSKKQKVVHVCVQWHYKTEALFFCLVMLPCDHRFPL